MAHCPPPFHCASLPLLLQTPPGLGRRALLLKKLRLCSHWLDLGPAGVARHLSLPPREREAEARARETKRLALLELVNYFSVARPLWAADELAAVFDMLAHNLFRPLPPSSFETQRWTVTVGTTCPAGGSGAAHGSRCVARSHSLADCNRLLSALCCSCTQASPLLSIFLRSRLSLCCDSSRALGCP